MRRIPSGLTYANVISTLCLFLLLGGGTAVALSGHNTVQSDDLGPGAQVKAPDVADNAVDSAGIKNGAVSVRDTNKVIPSGATITGAFRESEDNEGGAVSNLQFGVDFYGLRAPKALTDADVVFDNEGISATAALNDEEDPACTGGIGIPTAPPGKACVYLFYEQVRNNSATASPLGFGTGFDQADDKGFLVSAQENNGLARLAGTWAYHAP